MSFSLSVVIPAYNEELNILLAIDRVSRLLDSLGYAWEMILIDDGSSDASFAMMKQAASNDRRVKVVRFSRNFGFHIATTAGLAHAQGDACLVITADLEEPPEMIPSFVGKWQEGCEVVWAIRNRRNEPLGTRLAASLFHTLFRLFGLPKYSRQTIGGGFFLIDRKVVDVLRKVGERNRTLIGLISWMGFSQGYVYYTPLQRHSGSSKWTLGKKVKLAIDSFVSFSYMPIRLVSILGISIALLSFLYGLGIIMSALIGSVAVQGWPTLMVTVLFLSGLQLLVSGMLGEYIWRTLDESRQRPLYIVSETLGFSDTEAAAAGTLTHMTCEGEPPVPK